MGATNSNITHVDGSLDWSAGVDSIRVTTVASQQNPNGLPRNGLAWLQNATVRDGGIQQRFGWQLVGTIHNSSGLYQGGFMYEPDAANPYLVLAISGHLYRVKMDGTFSVDEISTPATLNPSTEPTGYMTQAEQFLIVQAGDAVTLPLFWDGTTLRRSNGLAGAPREIPAATAMDYYMGRLWYAQGRKYAAGDIVGGASGTAPYQFRDSVLRVTENLLAIGGDGFIVPTNAGNIRALKHSINLNTQLGQGALYVFTRKAIYSLSVPVTRANWIAATNANQPLQTVIQLVNGAVNDRSVVAVNGDLFFQSLEPSIRSMVVAVRDYQQWGNINIAAAETRVLQQNDRSLMFAASGIEFEGRLIQSALPKQLPQGVVHQAMIPLDFIPLSSLMQSSQPIWEGVYEGLDVLQMFTGDFGGNQRAFAVVVSRVDQSMQLWELMPAAKYENGDNRVTWAIEFPAFTWGDEFALKKLMSAEVWVDRLFCKCDFNMEYRPDGETCWLPWHRWQECEPRNPTDQGNPPSVYPTPDFGPCYRATMTLPVPSVVCEPCSSRPSNVAYQFQLRLTVTGFCRIRGLLIHAAPVERALYQGKIC